MEVVISDGIGVSTIEVDAIKTREAVIIAATDYVRKTVSDGFRFDNFRVVFETDNIVRLVFERFESGDGSEEPIYFEAIE